MPCPPHHLRRCVVPVPPPCRGVGVSARSVCLLACVVLCRVAGAAAGHLQEGWAASSAVVGGRVYYTMEGGTVVWGEEGKVFDAAALGGVCAVDATRTSPATMRDAKYAGMSSVGGAAPGEAWCSSEQPSALPNYLQLELDHLAEVHRIDFAGLCSLAHNTGCAEFTKTVTVTAWDGQSWVTLVTSAASATVDGEKIFSVYPFLDWNVTFPVQTIRFHPQERVSINARACLRVDVFSHCTVLQQGLRRAKAQGMFLKNARGLELFGNIRVSVSPYPLSDVLAVRISHPVVGDARMAAAVAATPSSPLTTAYFSSVERNTPHRHLLYLVDLKKLASASDRFLTDRGFQSGAEETEYASGPYTAVDQDHAAGKVGAAEALSEAGLLVYECGPRFHPYCTRDGGVPFLFSAQSDDGSPSGSASYSLLRPSGSGKVFRVHTHGDQASLVLIHNANEWRGLALVAESHNDTSVDDRDLASPGLQSGWKLKRSEQRPAIRYKDILGRMEGAAVAKITCSDVFQARQVYTVLPGENNAFLTSSEGSLLDMIFSDTLAAAGADMTMPYVSSVLENNNRTRWLRNSVQCSASSDFSFALKGRDCVTVDTSSGRVHAFGEKVGIHLPWGCSTKTVADIDAAVSGTRMQQDPAAADIASRVFVDMSGQISDTPSRDFFVELSGVLYFRGSDAQHGLELLSYRGAQATAQSPFPISGHYFGVPGVSDDDIRDEFSVYRKTMVAQALKDPSATPQRCLETYLDGATFYLGFVSSLAAERRSFHLHLAIRPAYDITENDNSYVSNTTSLGAILSHVEPLWSGEGASAGASPAASSSSASSSRLYDTSHIESWLVSSQHNGIGMTFLDIRECGLDIEVGNSSTTSKRVAVVASVGGCSAVPLGPSPHARFTAVLDDEGVLNVTRTDKDDGWTDDLRLRCWLTGCAGGVSTLSSMADAANSDGYTDLDIRCGNTSCTLSKDDTLLTSTLNVTTVLSHMSSVLQYGATLGYPLRSARNGFTGFVKDVRIDGACVMPDLTDAQAHGCNAPLVTSAKGPVRNLNAVDGFFFYMAVPAEHSTSEGTDDEATHRTVFPHSDAEYVMYDYGSTPAVVREVVWRCSERNKNGGCPRRLELQYLPEAEVRWATYALLVSEQVEAKQTWRVTDDELSGRVVVSARYWRVKLTEGDLQGQAALDYLALSASCYAGTSAGNVFAAAGVAADLAIGLGGSSPLGGVLLNGALLFLAASDSVAHLLYRFTGDNAQPKRIFNEPLLFHSSVAPSTPHTLALPNVGVAVWAVRGGLLLSDGSAAGTQLHRLPVVVAAGGQDGGLVLLREEGDEFAEIAYFCENSDALREGTGGAAFASSAGGLSGTALCIVHITHSTATPVLHRIPTSLGTLTRVSHTKFFLSSRGLHSSDVINNFYLSGDARRAHPKSFTSLKTDTCLPPALVSTLDPTLPDTAVGPTGFLSISTNEQSTLSEGMAALLSFTHADAIKSVDAISLSLSVLSINFQGTDVTTREANNGPNQLGTCDMITVELMDPSYSWDDAAMTYNMHSSTAAAGSYVLNSMNVSTAPFMGGGVVGIDLAGLLESRASRLGDTVTLRLSIDSATCTGRTDPYRIVFASARDPTPAFRPALCLGHNTVSAIRFSETRHISLPKPAARSLRESLSTGHGEDTPLPSATWFYVGCASATVKFKLPEDAVIALHHAQPPNLDTGKEVFVAPLLDVQVTRGVVEVLPDSLVMSPDGGLRVEARRGAATLQRDGGEMVFATTQPHLHPLSCNYAAPSAGDEVFFGFLDNGAAPQVSILELCSAATCEASGGVCYGFSCVCPSSMVSIDGNTCECAPGYYGEGCVHFCDAATTCGGRGVCTSSGNCKCRLGFGGRKCQQTLTCTDLRKLYPKAAIDCSRISDSPVTTNRTSSPITQEIDSCRACIEEGYETINGVRRYFCRQSKS